MITVNLPKSDAYQSLYALSGYGVRDSLIITNDTPQTIFLTQSDTQPVDDSNAFFAHPYQTVLAHADGKTLWIRGKPGPVVVQKLSSTVTPFTSVELPHDIMTREEEGFRRVRVDTGQTSFWVGTEARSFKDLNIPSGGTYVIKVVVPVNTVLWNVTLSIDSGAVKLSTISGGTDDGGFTTQLPLFPKNAMSSRLQPYYVFQNKLYEGGTQTGGTVIDVVRIATSGSTAQRQTVGGSVADERGVSPGTYYWKFENTSNNTVVGTFHCSWEERV